MYYFRFLMVAGMFLMLSGAVVSYLPVHETGALKLDLLR